MNSDKLLTPGGDVSGFFNIPTTFYEFDPARPRSGLVALTHQPDVNGGFTWTSRLLLLPNGQVLCSTNGTTFALYRPSTAELKPAVSRPSISNFGSAQLPMVLKAGQTYTLSGTHFNGFSQANSYGDDAQMATNYPIVQLTGVESRRVQYLRSFNFSSLGIAVPGSVSCDVEVPLGMSPGAWDLVVIANGIASAAVRIYIDALANIV
ncbi:hypothetical protein [Bradyrhizobium genosp. P]|uniref:hypothetical protein n=1 Tax=Bradyrhizobium genosp. P TaxID=83641 RepID=UPI003CFB31AE